MTRPVSLAAWRETPGLARDTAPSAARDAERRRELEKLARLARWLDARYKLPFVPIRIGVDGLVGLIPGIGDTLVLLPSAYLVMRGWQLGARKRTIARMAANTGVDYVVGLVPIVGDLLDIGFKGNLRNIGLLERDFATPGRAPDPGA